jgi:hypothetical protein
MYSLALPMPKNPGARENSSNPRFCFLPLLAFKVQPL